MKGAELPRIIGALKQPIDTFIRDARIRVALLVNRSGQVLAQHGFTSSYEVMNVASLAAAAHATSQALADLTAVGDWSHLHHAGTRQELFLATLATPAAPLILVAIFDGESSLGLVQLFFGQLARRVAALPELQAATGSADQQSFEADLEAGIARAFKPEPGTGV
ncbi:MAG: roadblock/LC7 domain-containing protein [Gemmatimonadetes bacterium]|nr:roadblock/LC7 domain-containing protein [Gemmatimonadota bacterium]